MVDRIGTEIASYRIESLIARGGMGEVWLATQSFPERKGALKLLPHDLASDGAFREWFIRESNAAASVEHPNIVPIYGAGMRTASSTSRCGMWKAKTCERSSTVRPRSPSSARSESARRSTTPSRRRTSTVWSTAT